MQVVEHFCSVRIGAGTSKVDEVSGAVFGHPDTDASPNSAEASS